MIGKYEIEFVGGSIKNYEGDLKNRGKTVCIDSGAESICIPKSNIKHIWKKQEVNNMEEKYKEVIQIGMV